MKQPSSDILFSYYTFTLFAIGFSALAPVEVCLLGRDQCSGRWETISPSDSTREHSVLLPATPPGVVPIPSLW